MAWDKDISSKTRFSGTGTLVWKEKTRANFDYYQVLGVNLCTISIWSTRPIQIISFATMTVTLFKLWLLL